MNCFRCAKFDGEWRCEKSEPPGRQTYSLKDSSGERFPNEACANFEQHEQAGNAGHSVEANTLFGWESKIDNFNFAKSALLSDGWQPTGFTAIAMPNEDRQDVKLIETFVR